ncbi:O-antigen ligase like membrane family protein [Aphanothece sacrum FPU1]|uniref:O-antigen ligase like membrane family protein n=3 Tax=Aphanothece sacrum TaxID=1122 RepID=A0A401IJN6_APHSA|nr:O-antigen ligase like membrane family protein [Aphanothece sacrum FPU1]
MANDLGPYDGFSATLNQTVQYGFPYFLGRIYLTNFSSLKKLVIAIFLGGLVYVPLCLYEVKMSPQLHRMVYGYEGTRSFLQSIRLGGYRPTVFMRHGLSVAMWMMAATLIGIWLWQSGMLKKLWNIPMTWLIGGMMITFILLKSTGAYVYLLYGLVVLFTAKWFRNAIPLLFLIFSISFYLFLGATGNFAGQNADQVISFVSQIVPPERVESLAFRFDNEEALVQKAMKQPILGWGGWGRNRVFDYNYADELVDVSITDSLWIMSYGVNGAVGLFSIFAVSLLPPLVFLLRYPARIWFHPQVAPAAIVAIILPLYMLDCTINNQFNPVFMVMSGALSGFVLTKANPITRRVISTQTRRNLTDNTNLI